MTPIKEPIDWENPFKAEDFLYVDMSEPKPTCRFGPTEYQAKRIADRASEIFRELLKEHGIKVFTNDKAFDENEEHVQWSEGGFVINSHSGILIAAKELENKNG